MVPKTAFLGMSSEVVRFSSVYSEEFLEVSAVLVNGAPAEHTLHYLAYIWLLVTSSVYTNLIKAPKTVFLGISRGSGGDMKVSHPLVGLTVLSLVDNVASYPGAVSMLKTLGEYS